MSVIFYLLWYWYEVSSCGNREHTQYEHSPLNMIYFISKVMIDYLLKRHKLLSIVSTNVVVVMSVIVLT